ncbi:MAG: iron-sulfur cluster insertion protein ErpA [Alphaproteobacteria bacterium]|nr:iron-sulfur cluster insertion protein ErpA [Alphaproteobacteria bacterium]
MATSVPLTLSDSAAKRVDQLRQQENRPAAILRVTVSSGGCSGFQYGFDFDDKITADDIVVENQGVKLVTDNLSLLYLAGSQVDYVEDMMGAAFKITNPNATASCSCGSSFTVA